MYTRYMPQVIYLDVLLCVNLFVTYFLLLSAAMLSHASGGRLRRALGALAGAVSSLLIFLPEINFLLLFAIKLLLGALLVLISFKWESPARFLKTCLWFFGTNFIYGGVCLALWLLFPVMGMKYHNATAYFDISPLTLAVSTVIGYLVTMLVQKLMNRRVPDAHIATLSITIDNITAEVKCLVDTGNSLCDPLSGTLVAIVEKESIRMLPNPKKPRLIPAQTVAGDKLLRGFVPDKTTVNGAQKKLVIVATDEKLSDGAYKGIIPND
jgi:Sporulation factor SpoIIGA.